MVEKSNIKSSWNNGTDNFAMRVFSTRAAEKQAVLHHFQTLLADQTCAKVQLTAYDEEFQWLVNLASCR